MLSRVADSLYWMGRYIERAESVARLIDVNAHLMLDLPESVREQWRPIVETTGQWGVFSSLHAEANLSNVIQFLCFDEGNPGSIVSSVRAARENARSVREVITSEMWEHINGFYLTVHDREFPERARSSLHETFTHIKMASHLFCGITDATMSHGEGWHFCRLGRELERADNTTRILDVKYFILLPSQADVGSPMDDLQWSALLRSASGFQMYRQTCGRINPRDVADFLVFSREFPRSVQFCLASAEESLHAVTGSPMGVFCNAAEQRLGQLRSQLAFTSVDEVIAGGLHEFLDGLEARINQVDQAVFETFFALRPVAAEGTGHHGRNGRDVLPGYQGSGGSGRAGRHESDVGQ